MAAVDDLITTRDQIAANLVIETRHPKPSYSVDGKAVDWNSWAKTQQDRIEQLNRMINAMRPYQLSIRQVL